MAGTVFLGGGGTPVDEQNVWREAYSRVESVLYWPFALTGPILDTADQWFRAALSSLELTAAQVATWTSLEGHSAAELGRFDLLHVGGGNTFRLLDEIRRHSFLLTGLALVPVYSVLPHYHNGLTQWSQAWAREQHRTVLALPERGGVRFHNDAFTVIGPEPHRGDRRVGPHCTPGRRVVVSPRSLDDSPPTEINGY